MAVQKSKKSRSKRGMRRAHDSYQGVALTTNEKGMTHLRHHIASDGTYRGKQILIIKKDEDSTTNKDEVESL